MGYNGDNRMSLDSKLSGTHNLICSLMVLSHGALISTYCMLPQRKPWFVLLHGSILPIYNSRETVVSPPYPPAGMLIFQRTLVKSPVAQPTNFTQLTGSIQVHPSTSRRFMEDTINPKPQERKGTLCCCIPLNQPHSATT